MVNPGELGQVEIFQSLTVQELETAGAFCQEESYPEGVTLCEEGERADKLFILQEGEVSIRFRKGVNYAVRTPGKILGWSFLVPPNRYTASAVTIAPSRVLVIKSPDFYELVHQDSRMGLKIMDNLARVVASRLKAYSDYY